MTLVCAGKRGFFFYIDSGAQTQTPMLAQTEHLPSPSDCVVYPSKASSSQQPREDITWVTLCVLVHSTLASLPL